MSEWERFHESNCLSMCYHLAVYKVYASILSAALWWMLYMPRAYIDFLLRYFTLSLSHLTMWLQSTLYSFMSVPSSLPYVGNVGNVCVCGAFVYNCYFLPPTCIYVCVWGSVSSPRWDAAPLVSCLTPEQTLKSERACQRKTALSYYWL